MAMAPRKKKPNHFSTSPTKVYESVKKGLDILLKSFYEDDTSTEYTFSEDLSTEERAYIHASALAMGLKSKSHGKGNDRKITVSKHEKSIRNKFSKLQVLPQTLEKTSQLLQSHPLSQIELQDVLPLDKQLKSAANAQGSHADCINYHMPVIPPPATSSSLLADRKNLPTWSHREEILNMISKNQVVMITGDTGSGKTTQVPQYLMECFSDQKQPVRIVCTQPRRIAAISVAERVANERGEQLGGTVGYQIRLENRMSSKTALLFCTTGILLRTLMYHDNNLEKVTHLIIDEVHERDRFCDFLLGVLRSRLPRFPNLRLILMSAALDVNVFSKYFDNCPILHVQGKCYPVTEYFLEDILDMTDHLNHASLMEIGVWEENDGKRTKNGKMESGKSPRNRNPNVDPNQRAIFDCWIQEVFIEDNAETFKKLSSAIAHQSMPVNYRHSQTKLTPLMVASARGRADMVKDFLKLGADTSHAAGQWTAIKLAHSMQHIEVVELLERHQSEKAESLLRIYKGRHDEDTVHIDLLLDLVHMIEKQGSEGAVLIFLPGYEEIMTIRDRIMYNDTRFASSGKYEVYTLHSSMQSGDQRRVFSRPPKGKRKIVLSTNLAETSVTIDDIVYVIDTGKVKVKSYDALTGVSALKAEWVPQASSIQRKGRAGRCQEGICYHMFSRERYESFEKYQIPEIFRVPLEELCLQSKNLSPADMSIAEFIGQVPEAPNPHVIQRAVKMLQWMDALDPWENVTDLGRLLLELPVEPRLGKMLLAAAVLHCLDPVLTIVCCLSYRDPFLLPSEPQEKKVAAARKMELAAGTLSDHMAMLRAFNLWQAARSNGKEREFCSRHYLSSSAMEVIRQLRNQILDQLRKSGFVRSIQELNSNSSNWVAVKCCILSGLYPQVARASRSGKISTRREASVRLHTTSALLGEKVEGGNGSQKKAIAHLPSEWMVYEEISRYGGLLASLRCVTVVNPVVLFVFGGHCRLPVDSIKDPFVSADDMDNEDEEEDDDDDDWIDASSDDSDEDLMRELSEGLDDLALAEEFSRSPLLDERNRKCNRSKKKSGKQLLEFHLDDWIRLRMERNTAHQLFALRQKWQALFARRMRDPLGPETEGEKQIVDALLDILSQEERASGLPPCPEAINLPGGPRRTRKFDQRPNSRQESNPAVENGQWRREDRPAQPVANYDAGRGSRRKDLRNLKFRTGIPDVDFAPDYAARPANSWRQKKMPRNGNDFYYEDPKPRNGGNGPANGRNRGNQRPEDQLPFDPSRKATSRPNSYPHYPPSARGDAPVNGPPSIKNKTRTKRRKGVDSVEPAI